MITSLFAGFNSTVRSMQHSQHALSVHSGNIAHANDPNYVRRDVLPIDTRGVDGPGILRLHDSFVDSQYRIANGMLGNAQARQDVLSKVEDVFGDPVNGGLRKSIDHLFDSWKGLAEAPTDGVARIEVLSAGRMFAQQIGSTRQQLAAIEQTVNEQMGTQVAEVNDLVQKVYNLNIQISDSNRHKVDDAALRDDRDLTLDRLSKLTGSNAIDNPDGTVKIVVGSTVVLDGPRVSKLEIQKTPQGPTPGWEGYGSPPFFGGTGSISGLISARDSELATLKVNVENLGRTVADAINAKHTQTVGGQTQTFFTTSGPVEVTASLKPGDIMAGTSGQPADGDNARAIAAMADQPIKGLQSPIIPGQDQPARTFYRNLVGWLGTRGKDAVGEGEIANLHLQAEQTQRQSKFGVSLDEEMAQLTMEQKSFAAAARVINVMDSMLDTLINKM